MENFFKSVLATLSFLLIIAFCMSGTTKPVAKARVISKPMFKTATFEQVPAIVNIEAQNENKFNWKTSKRP